MAVLDIHTLRDLDSGRTLAYYSNGHYSAEDFCAEMLKEYDKVVKPEELIQCWMRWEFCGKSQLCGNIYYKPGRGKFKVTYYEVE